MENLRKLSLDLEDNLNALSIEIRTLVDAEVLLGHLTEDMDKAVHLGEERTYYSEHHRMVRVLWNLMHYAMKNLHKEYEKVDVLQKTILRTVIGSDVQKMRGLNNEN